MTKTILINNVGKMWHRDRYLNGMLIGTIKMCDSVTNAFPCIVPLGVAHQTPLQVVSYVEGGRHPPDMKYTLMSHLKGECCILFALYNTRTLRFGMLCPADEKLFLCLCNGVPTNILFFINLLANVSKIMVLFCMRNSLLLLMAVVNILALCDAIGTLPYLMHTATP